MEINIATIKKWLAGAATIILAVILFGIIFVVLGAATVGPRFFIELTVVSVLVIILRIFWWNDGADRAKGEKVMLDLKEGYAKLIDTEILSQEELEEFLVQLNAENRDKWVCSKIGSKTPKNYPKYWELVDTLSNKVGKIVEPITSIQILTRSNRYKVLNAKNYYSTTYAIKQILSAIISVTVSIILAFIAFEEFKFSTGRLFKFITYLGTMAWTILMSLTSGYKTYTKETTDNISRLTMIVKRFIDWRKGGKPVWQHPEQLQQQAECSQISFLNNEGILLNNITGDNISNK